MVYLPGEIVDTLLPLALAAGFFGGFGHCIGMCGPIAAAYTLPVQGRIRSLAALGPSLAYSAGRITAYAFVGALMGLSGAFVDTAGKLAGVQNLASVLAGLFMVGAGLRIAGLLPFPSSAWARGAGLLKFTRLIVEAESNWKYYPLGILLGLIPCGLSYSLFIGAAGSGGLLEGTATMIAFGLGTLPAMLLFASLIGFVGGRMKRRLAAAGGFAVILMGLLFLARAIGIHVQV